MIKKIAWEAFKNTGDINMYLELKQIEDIEDKIDKNNFDQKMLTDKEKLIDIENNNYTINWKFSRKR